MAWLTYADTVGGRPMGPAPVSVPFGPAADAGAAAPVSAATLPATGGGLAVAALAALGAAVAVRRRG